MSGDKPAKPLSLSLDRTAFTMRDLDNAQPVIPPPRMMYLPNPRLAPPGMSGIRITIRPVGQSVATKEREAPSRAFKPLVSSPGKSRDFTR